MICSLIAPSLQNYKVINTLLTGLEFVECCANPFRFLQNNLRESFDSPLFSLHAEFLTLLLRRNARMQNGGFGIISGGRLVLKRNGLSSCRFQCLHCDQKGTLWWSFIKFWKSHLPSLGWIGMEWWPGCIELQKINTGNQWIGNAAALQKLQ